MVSGSFHHLRTGMPTMMSLSTLEELNEVGQQFAGDNQNVLPNARERTCRVPTAEAMLSLKKFATV
jgi:hypothetical protein